MPETNKSKTRKEIMERRRFPRVMADIKYRSPRLEPRKRPIHNISLGGVRIPCNEALEKGKELEMEFYLPSGYALVAIARVVWSRAMPKGSDAAFDVGLEFMHLNPDAAEELKKAISAGTPA
jgi:hypothetical protein